MIDLHERMLPTSAAVEPAISWSHRLIVLYICVKFPENIATVSELWSGHEYMVEMAMFNVQRVIIQVGKPELRFMCSAHLLVVVYIGVKFHKNISNAFRVMEWI